MFRMCTSTSEASDSGSSSAGASVMSPLQKKSQTLRKRSRRKREEAVPKATHTATTAHLSAPTAAVSEDAKLSAMSEPLTSPVSEKYQGPYDAGPVINQSTILAIGIFVFGLATIWPPLILLFAYVASKLIPYSFRVNDTVTERRKLFADFASQDNLPAEFKHIPDYIHLQESYWVNARGMTLCTTTMTPKHTPIRAVVCFCHGYTDAVSFMKQVEYQRLVKEGIVFCGLEVEGHGRSDGPIALINDWELMIDDTSSYFGDVVASKFPGKPIFLMGESMGGAVAYSTYNRIPDVFRGVVFVCPMCKISPDMLPPRWVVDFLCWIIGSSSQPPSVLGYLPIAPARKTLGEVAHKVRSKADLCSRSPLNFNRNPRLATSRELIRVTESISNSLADFDASFLVLHGLADVVTDPRLSQALYEESKSTDKDIRLYEGMYHGLTTSEPDENIDRVFNDAIQWILARS